MVLRDIPIFPIEIINTFQRSLPVFVDMNTITYLNVINNSLF